MSHDATNWAIKQRGIKPALKVVLWNLCDRYHKDNGCFPSQETLANDCEVSRSALNTHLDELEERGLISREQRRERGSNRMERTRYRFAFEEGFVAKSPSEPSPETGHGSEEAESKKQGGPCPENGESRVQNMDSNPVREPVREPVTEREGARAGSEDSETAIADDRRRIEKDFKLWYRNWPTSLSDSEPAARKAWEALTSDERAACIARTPAFVNAVKAIKGKFTFSSVYLSSKAWEKLDDPKSDVAIPSVHNPFSRAWMAGLLNELLKPASQNMPVPTSFQQQQLREGGDAAEAVRRDRLSKYGWPRVGTMFNQAYDRKGVTVRPILASLSETFERVHRDSTIFGDWKAAFERRGWPWLPNTGHEWFFFPTGNPDEAIQRFSETIARERGDDDGV